MKLDCAAHHCLVVLTSQPARVRRCVVQDQQKLRPGLDEGCTIGHNVLVHHFRPLFTLDFQVGLHEVQRAQCRTHPCQRPSPLAWSFATPSVATVSTFANTGDCARLNRNPGVHQCGTTALLVVAMVPQTKTHRSCVFSRDDETRKEDMTHTPGSAPRGRPMLRDAMSPSERSLRSQRCVVDSGTPSASAIFLLPRPCVAMRSAKRSSADRTMLLSECIETLEISWCMDWCHEWVMCVSVRCVKKFECE